MAFVGALSIFGAPAPSILGVESLLSQTATDCSWPTAAVGYRQMLTFRGCSFLSQAFILDWQESRINLCLVREVSVCKHNDAKTFTRKHSYISAASALAWTVHVVENKQ